MSPRWTKEGKRWESTRRQEWSTSIESCWTHVNDVENSPNIFHIAPTPPNAEMPNNRNLRAFAPLVISWRHEKQLLSIHVRSAIIWAAMGPSFSYPRNMSISLVVTSASKLRGSYASEGADVGDQNPCGWWMRLHPGRPQIDPSGSMKLQQCTKPLRHFCSSMHWPALKARQNVFPFLVTIAPLLDEAREDVAFPVAFF